MATTFSFDIVSEFDKGEMINVLDQCQRELTTRYDFKGSSASIEYDGSNKTKLKLIADHKMQLDALVEILHKKAIARSVDIKVFDLSLEPSEGNFKITKLVPLQSGIKQEQAKKITALIRDNLPKVKTQIQGESIRVTSAKKDELQECMNLIRSTEWDFAVNFINYR